MYIYIRRTKIYFALIKITFLLRCYRIPGLALMNENSIPFQSLQGCRGGEGGGGEGGGEGNVLMAVCIIVPTNVSIDRVFS